MEAVTMTECPVCGGCVLASELNGHMASHAKEDIVAALLRQRSPSGQIQDLSIPIARSHQPSVAASSSTSTSSHVVTAGFNAVQLIKKQTGVPIDATVPSPSTAGPFIMPQMMGMMQVTAPHLYAGSFHHKGRFNR